jgi:hypothetical protein
MKKIDYEGLIPFDVLDAIGTAYALNDVDTLKTMQCTYLEFYSKTKERSGLAILNCIDYYLTKMQVERLAECAKSEYLICKN